MNVAAPRLTVVVELGGLGATSIRWHLALVNGKGVDGIIFASIDQKVAGLVGGQRRDPRPHQARQPFFSTALTRYADDRAVVGHAAGVNAMPSPHFLQTVRKASWRVARYPGLPPDAKLLGTLAGLVIAGHFPLSDAEWQYIEAQVGLSRPEGASTGV